jgi:hypothetical protein
MGSPRENAIAAALSASADTAASPEVRLAACELLTQVGLVESILPALQCLATVPTCAGRARLLLRTREYLLRRGLLNDFVPIGSEGGTALQPSIPDAAATALWRHPDPRRASQNLLIVFTGIGKHLWLSLDLLHRVLRRCVGQILYLRDFHEVYFLAGVHGLGDDYASTLARLKKLARASSVEKLYVLGSSAGGHGALRYGLDLSADAILALSPATDLRNGVHEVIANRLRDLQIPAEELDVLPAYERAHHRPRVTIVYGADNPEDSVAAHRFAHLSEFRLVPVPNVADHDITAHLIGTGEFEQLLHELLTK